MKRRGSDGVQAVKTDETPANRARPSTKAGRPRPALKIVDDNVVLAPALSTVVGYLLRRAHNAFLAYWTLRFRDSETPITPVQGGMLVVIAANPGLTQTELARMMNVEGPTLMQSIDRLEQHGYLQRVRRPGDRRSYSLQLTPLGEDVLAAIESFLPVRDEDMLASLTKQEVLQLTGLLTKIVERGHLRLRQLQSEPPNDDDIVPAARQPRAAKTGPASQ
jgi:DNA-binding MarR family transcriptional regulator